MEDVVGFEEWVLFLFLPELLTQCLSCMYNMVITVLGERRLRFDEQPYGKHAILKVDRRKHPDESHLVLRVCRFYSECVLFKGPDRSTDK